MASDNDHRRLVVDEIYNKSQSDLSRLHLQLPQDAVAALAREVIERLANTISEPKVDRQQIKSLSVALIGSDAGAAATLIEQYNRAGIAVESIYLDYLGPAAAMLGEWWEADEATFSDVTLGTGRIYAIMRSLSHQLRPDVPPQTRSAVFAAVPGETHMLGVKMAVDLARKEGWEIEVHLNTDHDTLVEKIASSGELIIGLSAGGEHALPNLARLVLALRISAPNAKILVSGAIVDVAEDRIDLLDVDAVARSFEDAMAQLDQMWNDFQSDTA